jgi:hypothetical protein
MSANKNKYIKWKSVAIKDELPKIPRDSQTKKIHFQGRI